MSGALRISRAMALALPLALTGALAAPSAARAVAPSDARQGFDIPAQDLRAALEAFDTATGISVLYGSDLAAGRRSSALRALCAGRGAASVAGGHGPDRAGGRRQGFRAAAAPSAIRRRVSAQARHRRPSRRSCSSACWTPCAGSRPARRASTARAGCGSTGRADRFGAPAGFHGQRGARRGDTRGLAGLAGGRAVRRSGQGLRGAGVAAREPQAGGLRQRAACSATERE